MFSSGGGTEFQSVVGIDGPEVRPTLVIAWAIIFSARKSGLGCGRSLPYKIDLLQELTWLARACPCSTSRKGPSLGQRNLGVKCVLCSLNTWARISELRGRLASESHAMTAKRGKRRRGWLAAHMYRRAAVLS